MCYFATTGTLGRNGRPPDDVAATFQFPGYVHLKKTLSGRRVDAVPNCTFCLCPIPIVDDANEQEQSANEEATINAQNDFIDRRFWVVPNPNAIFRQ